MLGPSVKSRMFLMLPKIGIVSSADELKDSTPVTPTTGFSEPELLSPDARWNGRRDDPLRDEPLYEELKPNMNIKEG